MGIEKIAGNSSVSYQGSAAMAATTGTEAVTQSAGASAQMASAYAPMQDFSLNKNATENAEQSEELLTAQSSQLKTAVSDLNKQLKNSEAIFGIHEETNRVTIKIVDKDSDKVIKEFPAEETLDMIAKVWELAGVFLDERG